MREQLISYIDLLFAGNPEAADIRQEILQNTLDRYDDLISQGKTPEAAYTLAISGIGDVGELLGTGGIAVQAPQEPPEVCGRNFKILRAVAAALYILCPVPVLILRNAIGICALLGMVAVATGLLIAAGRGEREETPREKRKKSVTAAVSAAGLAIYVLVSFATSAWHITWLVLLITAAVCGLVRACMDLKEVQ